MIKMPTFHGESRILSLIAVTLQAKNPKFSFHMFRENATNLLTMVAISSKEYLTTKWNGTLLPQRISSILTMDISNEVIS